MRSGYGKIKTISWNSLACGGEGVTISLQADDRQGVEALCASGEQVPGRGEAWWGAGYGLLHGGEHHHPLGPLHPQQVGVGWVPPSLQVQRGAPPAPVEVWS